MANLIASVRQQLHPEFTTNQELYEPLDIERISTDDWSVERFIIEKKLSTADAVQMIKETMRWRHYLCLTTLTESHFPREFYLLGTAFSSGSFDREGNGLLFLRTKFHRKMEEMKYLGEQYTAFMVEQLDRSLGRNRGVTIVFDASNSGYANLDMESLGRLVQAISQYFPCGLKRLLVYEMLSIFSGLWSGIISHWLPAEFCSKVVFVNRKTIGSYISEEDLPFYMGGRCMVNPHAVPEGCTRSFAEWGGVSSPEVEGNKFSEKAIKKAFKMWKPMMEMAKREEKELFNAISSESGL